MAEDIVVNGVTYNGVDSIALKNKEGKDVRYFADAVRYMAQTLTEEQKAQARANIGAAAVGEGGGTGTGGTSIDVTAQVGQTIVVKEIDANGKPTKWESAEYQPRTHWKTETVKTVLESTELPFVEDMGGFVLMDAVDVVVGNTYVVNWNGTEYTSTAVGYESDGIPFVILGDAYTLSGGEMGTAPTGEPFVAMFVSAEYVEMIGMGAQIIPLDGSESLTISIVGDVVEYHQLDSQYIKDMYGSETGVILPETTADTYPELMGLAMFTPNYPLISGGKYTVVINGETYVKTAESYLGDSEFICIGNAGLAFDEEVTEEPFLIMYGSLLGDGNNTLYAMHYENFNEDNETASSTITLYIEGETEIVKIPAKYMPEIEGETVIYTMYGDGAISSSTTTFDFGVPIDTIRSKVSTGKNVILQYISTRDATHYQFRFVGAAGNGTYYFATLSTISGQYPSYLFTLNVSSSRIYLSEHYFNSTMHEKYNALEKRVAALENGTT